MLNKQTVSETFFFFIKVSLGLSLICASSVVEMILFVCLFVCFCFVCLFVVVVVVFLSGGCCCCYGPSRLFHSF